MSKITIGRNPQSTIVVESTYNTVSSNHATVAQENGNIVFYDHSTNGSYVNGVRVHNSSVVIRSGDNIMLGSNYRLNASDIFRYLGDSHGTQILPRTPATQRLNQQPNVAQQVNINIGGGQEYGQANARREIPNCVGHWNWGAFYFGWIWGIGNGVYWPLISLIPYIGWLVSFIIVIVLGVNGNQYAWEKFHGTAEEFEMKQHNWAVAAGICFLISIVLVAIILIVFATSL